VVYENNIVCQIVFMVRHQSSNFHWMYIQTTTTLTITESDTSMVNVTSIYCKAQYNVLYNRTCDVYNIVTFHLVIIYGMSN